MILRAAVNEGVLNEPPFVTLDRVNGGIPYFPGGEVEYLFGYALTERMVREANTLKTGVTFDGSSTLTRPEEVLGELSIRSAKRVPYLIDDNVSNLVGHSWITLWNKWVGETKDRTQKNFETLKKQTLTPYTDVTKNEYGVYGPSFSADGKWIAVTLESLDFPTALFLIDRKSGAKRNLTRKSFGVSQAFFSDSQRILFSSVGTQRHYYGFSELKVFDIERNSLRDVANSERAKDPDLSSANKAVYARSGHGKTWIEISDLDEDDSYTLKNTQVLYDPGALGACATPKFSKDGSKAVFSCHSNGVLASDIIEVNVTTKSVTRKVSHNAMARFPIYAHDGQIIFVSDVTGVDNLFKTKSEGAPALITNVLTGLWLPAVDLNGPQNEVYASHLSTYGWNLIKLTSSKESYNQGALTLSPPPAPVADAISHSRAAPETNMVESNYSAFKSLAPRHWYPTVEINSSFAKIGAAVYGNDTLDLHNYALAGAYLTGASDFGVAASYSNRHLGVTWSLFGGYEVTSFGDLGNGALVYTKDLSLGTGLGIPLNFTYWTLTPSLSLDFERSFLFRSDDESGPLQTSDTIPVVTTSLTYSDTAASRIAISSEEGREIRLAVKTYLVPTEPVTWKLFASDTEHLELFEHFVLVPSVAAIWASRISSYPNAIPAVAGYSLGLLEDAGSSVVHSFNKLYLRGYPAKVFLSRAVTVASAEMRFPLLRVHRGIHTHAAFVKNLYAFVFGEGAYFPTASIFLPSVGGGINLSTELFVVLPVTFSFQVYKGLKANYGGGLETIFSIRSPSFHF